MYRFGKSLIKTIERLTRCGWILTKTKRFTDPKHSANYFFTAKGDPDSQIIIWTENSVIKEIERKDSDGGISRWSCERGQQWWQ